MTAHFRSTLRQAETLVGSKKPKTWDIFQVQAVRKRFPFCKQKNMEAE